MGKGRHKTAVLAFATVLGFAAPMTLYAAGARYLDPASTPADAMPAYEIVTRVREMALEPASRPMRRGSYYVLHAYDRRGVEMRVVADAQLGDILSVAPVRPVAAAPLHSGPRIIHVPGPEDEQATAEPSDEPDAGHQALQHVRLLVAVLAGEHLLTDEDVDTRADRDEREHAQPDIRVRVSLPLPAERQRQSAREHDRQEQSQQLAGLRHVGVATFR